jgi:ABC-2 type transport system ATP-binding protein
MSGGGARAPAAGPAIVGRNLGKTFLRAKETIQALDDVSFELKRGELTALVGPDGAGKTTLIRLVAGLMPADKGELQVLGLDVGKDPQGVQDRIGYMPQRFGLYEDLTVQENLDLYADLHGAPAEERRRLYPELMQMTQLGRFTKRLAGRLSGGMKQKLGLACTLVSSPDLLLLDEPTVGVDPLSRRELWQIIDSLVKGRGLTVLISTSYLDEAERCDHAIVLRQGKVLAQGRPAEVVRLAEGRVFLADPQSGETARKLQARLIDQPGVIDAVPDGGRVRFVRAEDGAAPTDASALGASAVTPTPPRFEDGFMVLLERGLHAEAEQASSITLARAIAKDGAEPVVQVKDLVRRFGDFIAVNHISFEVRRGEIFGLLGPNGAGKTTTFRMLCGLLPASGGTLRVAGKDLLHSGAEARQPIGYVAQKFSLYGKLTVIENLEFFASAYSLSGHRKRERIDWALTQFDLKSEVRAPAGQLPGGFKQRLAMGAALLHEPEILFLDEPTSGADPLARRAFWRRITALSDQGVTVIVTTHFMPEAEYCDRIAILDSGRILAQGTPAEVRARAPETEGRGPTMEDAFIAIVETAREADGRQGSAA